MKSPILRRTLVWRALGLAGVLQWVTAMPAFSKCVMCAKSAEYAGEGAGTLAGTFLVGALVLLVPVFTASGGLALLLWKNRQGGEPALPEANSRAEKPTHATRAHGVRSSQRTKTI